MLANNLILQNYIQFKLIVSLYYNVMFVGADSLFVLLRFMHTHKKGVKNIMVWLNVPVLVKIRLQK